jgi:hypothetical protein
MVRCRVPRQNACGSLPVKTAVRMILFDKKTPLDRTSFNGSINGTLFLKPLLVSWPIKNFKNPIWTVERFLRTIFEYFGK